MSKTIWQVWTKENDYWTRVQWAPTFDTQEEADKWLAQADHDWDAPVQVMDITVSDAGWFTSRQGD